MNANDRNLLSDILDEYADRLGNDGCNDWEWPKEWNEAYRRDFLKRYNAWADADGIEDTEYHKKYGPDNVDLVYFLRYLFRQEVK